MSSCSEPILANACFESSVHHVRTARAKGGSGVPLFARNGRGLVRHQAARCGQGTRGTVLDALFYTAKGSDVVVVAVEYASRDCAAHTSRSDAPLAHRSTGDAEKPGPLSADRFMQFTASMTVSDVLRKLIRACVDDECTLRHESTLVDAGRAEALTRLARERERFVGDLERLAECAQPHYGSWSELSREAKRNVWVAAAGRNSGDAIASCRRSRARTEARYDEALQSPWPDEVQRVLAAQRRRLHDETDELARIQFRFAVHDTSALEG